MVVNDLRFDSYLRCDHGTQILVCSFSSELKNIIAALLHDHDVKLTWTDSPDDLVDNLRLQQYSLVIIDLTKLKHQGNQAARLIKNEQVIKHIPMILLHTTPTAVEDMIEGCQGCIEYLLKPYNPIVLKQKIVNFIQLHNYLTLIKSKDTDLSENGLLTSELIKNKIAADHGDIYIEINHNLEITNLSGHEPLFCWNNSVETREKNLRKIFTKQKLEFLIPRIERALKLKTTLSTEIKIDMNWYGLRVYPINWGAAIYFRNINKQKIQEQNLITLSRFKVIGELAASIAHEIRNPMTTVRALLELAKLSKRSIPTSKVDTMVKEIDRTNKLITELLTLAKQPKQKEVYCLHEIINDVQPLLSAKASRSSKNIIYKLQPCTPRLFNIKEITQIILNIGLNGIEAMEEQGNNLIISTKEQDHKQIIMISDEGTGIPLEKIQNIWDPFFTTKDKGTGLGLTICQKIAHNNQAEISVNSNNAGTTFTIQFRQP